MDGAVLQVDVPRKYVVAAFAHDVRLVVIGVGGFDVLRREREKTQAIGRRAPVAVQANLLKLDHDRVARLRAFDVERARQRIAAFRALFSTVILSAGVQRFGDDDIAGLDPLENRVGVRERAVVVVRDHLKGLGKQRYGRKDRKENVWAHFLYLHERVTPSSRALEY